MNYGRGDTWDAYWKPNVEGEVQPHEPRQVIPDGLQKRWGKKGEYLEAAIQERLKKMHETEQTFSSKFIRKYRSVTPPGTTRMKYKPITGGCITGTVNKPMEMIDRFGNKIDYEKNLDRRTAAEKRMQKIGHKINIGLKVVEGIKAKQEEEERRSNKFDPALDLARKRKLEMAKAMGGVAGFTQRNQGGEFDDTGKRIPNMTAISPGDDGDASSPGGTGGNRLFQRAEKKHQILCP